VSSDSTVMGMTYSRVGLGSKRLFIVVAKSFLFDLVEDAGHGW
jgi:hypothetical protein